MAVPSMHLEFRRSRVIIDAAFGRMPTPA